MKIRSFLFATIILASTTGVLNAQSTESKSSLKRGDAFVAQENYKAAIEEYRKVSARDGDLYARAIYNIGVCHYELWQTEEAIVFYKRAIELKQGNYPRASYALGVALEDQGRLTEAKASVPAGVARQILRRLSTNLACSKRRQGSLRKPQICFEMQPRARSACAGES